MAEFDKSLKTAIVNVCFLQSRKYRSTWVKQVQQIDKYWDQMINNLKLNELMDMFILHGNENDCDAQDVVLNTQRALSEWRIELMTQVANKITQLMNDEVEGDFVVWNGDQMMFLK